MQAYLCFLEEIAYQFVYKKYDQLACTSVLVCIPDPSFVYIAMSCVMFHTRPSITTYTPPHQWARDGVGACPQVRASN